MFYTGLGGTWTPKSSPRFPPAPRCSTSLCWDASIEEGRENHKLEADASERVKGGGIWTQSRRQDSGYLGGGGERESTYMVVGS